MVSSLLFFDFTSGSRALLASVSNFLLNFEPFFTLYEPFVEPPAISLLAQRGKCTFVDKARAARDGGFDGLVIFNTDASGLIPMPAGGAATDDLDVPAFMVDNGVGKALERVLRWKETTRVEAWVGSSDACVSLSPPLVRPPPRPTDPEDLEDWPDVAGNATFQCGPRSVAVPPVWVLHHNRN